MNTSTHREKIISGLGGFVAISGVFWVTQQFEQGLHARLLLIASMGATAVLLFAAPKSPLSQPWNVIGGHVVSALVGVAVYRLVDNPVLGGGLAVGLAITAMYYLQCLHPPGGATSLIPMISGAVMGDYGFWFVLFPIGLGAALMVAIAVVFNLPFPWRRYPQVLAERMAPPHERAYPDISHADFVAALSEIDTYVDISEQDLVRIYELATRKADSHAS